ncbi:hypothetical protein ZWY2020_028406 [Hordeum vulgare]|nr:hypothetical protein ZWY2020_028406 [Hordeum vulgare]
MGWGFKSLEAPCSIQARGAVAPGVPAPSNQARPPTSGVSAKVGRIDRSGAQGNTEKWRQRTAWRQRNPTASSIPSLARSPFASPAVAAQAVPSDLPAPVSFHRRLALKILQKSLV